MIELLFTVLKMVGRGLLFFFAGYGLAQAVSDFTDWYDNE